MISGAVPSSGRGLNQCQEDTVPSLGPTFVVVQIWEDLVYLIYRYKALRCASLALGQTAKRTDPNRPWSTLPSRTESIDLKCSAPPFQLTLAVVSALISGPTVGFKAGSFERSRRLFSQQSVREYSSIELCLKVSGTELGVRHHGIL